MSLRIADHRRRLANRPFRPGALGPGSIALLTAATMAMAARANPAMEWISDREGETPAAATSPPLSKQHFDLLAPLAAVARSKEFRRDSRVQTVAVETPDDVPRMAVASGSVCAIAENGAPRALPPAAPAPQAHAELAPRDAPVAVAGPEQRAPLVDGPADSTLTVLPTDDKAAPREAGEHQEMPPVTEPLPQTPEPLAAPGMEAELRPYRPVSQLTVDIAPPSGLMPAAQQSEELPLPEPAPLVDDPRRTGGWASHDKQWAATNMYHRPLYFEQINLERYGYTMGECVQPILSGAHFFLVIPALPYKMAVAPQRTCVYTLGHYRPGSCVPRQVHWPQTGIDGAGAVAEAATALSLIFLIP